MSLIPKTTFHQPRGHKLVTGPTEEPVSVTELREALKLDKGVEETFLQSLIIEAREYIETMTGLAFLTQTWKLTLDQWPVFTSAWWEGVREGAITELYSGHGSDYITLPRYPLQSITSVKTYDISSVETVISVSDIFDVDNQSIRGRMVLKYGEVWPSATRRINAIEIVYIAGYGDNWSDVPAPLRAAVRQMAAYSYMHRGDCDTETSYSKSGAASLIAKYATVRL